MHDRTLSWPRLASALGLALLLFAPAWARMDHLFTRDWPNFDDLSWTVRTIVLHLGRLPLHQPWFCGGLDLVQNPQNRIFSPFGLLDLALPPQWANLTSLTLYAAAGALGMFTLLIQEFAASFATALVGAALFIGSSWFGLRFCEGHIPYGSIQLLPWIYLLGRRILRPEWHARIEPTLFALGAIFTFMLLDGGIYAFIFSLMLLATLPPPRAALASLARAPGAWARVALIGLATATLSAVKMYPVLQAIRHRNPGAEFTVMPVKLLLQAFFYPWQSLDLPVDPSLPWRFHEFGCYIGFVAPLVVIWAAVSHAEFRARLRRAWRMWIPMLLALWIGSGFLEAANPWNLFRRIPLLNNVHVQSRIFIFLLFFGLIFLAQALELLRKRSVRVYAGVLAFLLIELLAVRISSFDHLAVDGGTPIGWHEWIPSETIATTLEYGYGPSSLRLANTGTKECYEPSFMGPKVARAGEADYRGEAYVARGEGHAALAKFLPGRIEADYDVPAPVTIAFNTRVLAGWKAIAPTGAVVHPLAGNGLLAAEVPAGAGQLVLEYTPHYLRVIFPLFFIGWTLWGLAAWLVFGTRKTGEA